VSKRISKKTLGLIVWGALALSAIGAWWMNQPRLPAKWEEVQRLPNIFPDYCNTVIPPNIAPLNFKVNEVGNDYRVRIYGENGEEILLSSRRGKIIIPPKPWRELLLKNRGGQIQLEVYVKSEKGGWQHFEPVENAVAQENIDSHLAYRLLGSVCNMYNRIGIYQRNLETYEETPVVVNERGGCINCHSFSNNDPNLFSFHVRPGSASAGENIPAAMIGVRDGRAEQFKTTGAPGYISWRADGKAVAFALGMPRQIFRSHGPEIRDVFDCKSDLAIADTSTGQASASPEIQKADHLETFPCWSADGKTLYYCTAPTQWSDEIPMDSDGIKNTMFDLMRIAYDIESDTWGEPEVVLASADVGKSLIEPRTSPDGKYLLFCMSDYGGFPINQESCDLYMMELSSGAYRRLECNSDKTDSWHSWSNNSRWIVFSSKRDNGLFARPYICYIDEEGREHKPFPLPQKDPDFYDTFLRTYNLPELVSGPITLSQEELLDAYIPPEMVDDSSVPWRQESTSYQ